jgi:hypothetical protein
MAADARFVSAPPGRGPAGAVFAGTLVKVRYRRVPVKVAYHGVDGLDEASLWAEQQHSRLRKANSGHRPASQALEAIGQGVALSGERSFPDGLGHSLAVAR